MIISSRYGKALQWAEEIHRPQRRKGKPVPYISHLISVSALVWEDGGNEDQAIAALLHGDIEDAGQSHTSIAERFGGEVADIVRDCTDTSFMRNPHHHQMSDTIGTLDLPFFASVINGLDSAFGGL